MPKTVAMGLIASLAIAATGATAWLFWPVQRASFDWQSVAGDMIAVDDCPQARELLLLVAEVEPVEVRTFLGGRTYGGSCASDSDNRRGVSQFDLIMDTARFFESSGEAARHPAVFRERSSQFWPFGRTSRARAGMGFFGLPEFITWHRCLRPFTVERKPGFYSVRRRAAEQGMAVTPPSGAARRASWCLSFIDAQALSLQRGDGASNPHIQELIVEYRLHTDYLSDLFPSS